MDHWFYCLHSSWHSVKHSEETWRVVPRIHGYGLEMAERLEGLGAGTEELSWQGSWQFRSLIEVLLHVGGNVLDGQHGLLACGLDLRLGQQEAVTTSVTQLKGVGILHTQVVGPVVRATSSRVWGKIRRGGLFRYGGYADDLRRPKRKKKILCLLEIAFSQAKSLLFVATGPILLKDDCASWKHHNKYYHR